MYLSPTILCQGLSRKEPFSSKASLTTSNRECGRSIARRRLNVISHALQEQLPGGRLASFALKYPGWSLLVPDESLPDHVDAGCDAHATSASGRTKSKLPGRLCTASHLREFPVVTTLKW